jgi:hypothetical protein
MLIRGHEQHERPDLAPHQPESHGEADDDEGERAALAEEQAGLDRGVARQAEGEAQAGGDGRLEDEETGDRRQDPERLLGEQPVVDAHGDGH